MKRAWLASVTWPVVVEINRGICAPSRALHKATSDGYANTQQLWESSHRTEMSLPEAADLCRRCHRLAPFCNFNGNSFVAIIRQVVSGLQLPPDQLTAIRSVVGHIVAGTATPEEEEALRKTLETF